MLFYFGVGMRSLCGLFTAYLLSIMCGRLFINKCKKFLKAGRREYTPDTHELKNDTPTMGGLLIIFISIVSIGLWSNLKDPYVLLFLLCLISFAIIGALDDISKIKKHGGLSTREKFFLQLFFATIIALGLIYFNLISSYIFIPFLKLKLPIGFLMIPWIVFVIVGTSNAVNLTDGIDGLAVSSLVINFCVFAIICFLISNYMCSFYFGLNFLPVSELMVISSILIGSLLGFLWYNAYPALVFMGDVGSLSLGACLAFLALACKVELLLILTGGLFVVEALSVIFQVVSMKFIGRRIFKMAPLHHHFELLGMHESQITTRCTIISFFMSVVGLIIFLL